MKKNNIVELRAYREESAEKTPVPTPETVRDDNLQPAISKELQLAIKRLIQRMRKRGPIRKAKRA